MGRERERRMITREGRRKEEKKREWFSVQTYAQLQEGKFLVSFSFPTKLLSFMVQGCVIRFLDDATILACKYIHARGLLFQGFPHPSMLLSEHTKLKRKQNTIFFPRKKSFGLSRYAWARVTGVANFILHTAESHTSWFRMTSTPTRLSIE